MRFAFLLPALLVLFVQVSSSQTLVSTEPSNRNIVLEDFTGIRCPFSPEGHALAESIRSAYPNNTVIINIHTGQFAAPEQGFPDFTTKFGDIIAIQAEVSSYPSATVNRLSKGNARSTWAASAAAARQLSSPVNVGAKSDFDPATRKLTITVEAYYTANSASFQNYLNIALLENNVKGFQADSKNGWFDDYTHNHILRTFLTGYWGETIFPATKGSFITKTYVYTVPASYNADNCEVAVFLTESYQKEIYTGVAVEAAGGTTQKTVALTSDAVKFRAGRENTPGAFPLRFENLVKGQHNVRLRIETNAPSDWKIEGKVRLSTFSASTPATFSLGENEGENVEVTVTPGAMPCAAVITVWFESADMPKAEKKSVTFNVVSGVRDLIVSPPAAAYSDKYYIAGLIAAGRDGVGTATQEDFSQFSRNLCLGGVKNIFFNIGTVVPAIPEGVAEELKKAMNEGKNVMIAGQDIGWDISSGEAGSHGTTGLKSFYTDYLHAKYVANGSVANANVSPFAGEEIFGTTLGFTIGDLSGAGLRGEIIQPLGNATAIYKYNNDPTKIGGIRAETKGSKLVYLGFGIEQITNRDKANILLQKSSDWFEGLISGVEFDGDLARITAAPNPASVFVGLDIPDGATHLTILNPQGFIMQQLDIAGSSVSFSVEDFPVGAYCFSFADNSGAVVGRGVFVVVK